MTLLAEAISSAALVLTRAHAEQLAAGLAIAQHPTRVGLLQTSDRVALPAFRTVCEQVWQAWEREPEVPGAALALAVRASSSTAGAARSEFSVTPVVTGPTSWHVPVRQTSDVILRLVEQAQDAVLLSSFAAYKVPALVSALRAALERGVSVRMLLETVSDSGGAVTIDAAAAFAGLPGLDVLFWPLDRRPERGPGQGKASMHAKVVVADRQAAFITSANLTGSALERNLEVGILVTGGPLPGQLVDHFEELQASGVLAREDRVK